MAFLALVFVGFFASLMVFCDVFFGLSFPSFSWFSRDFLWVSPWCSSCNETLRSPGAPEAPGRSHPTLSGGRRLGLDPTYLGRRLPKCSSPRICCLRSFEKIRVPLLVSFRKAQGLKNHLTKDLKQTR